MLVLSSQLRVALLDCLSFNDRSQPYIWKPASMRKLESLGLVAGTGREYYGRQSFEVTAEGRAAAAEIEAQRTGRSAGASRDGR